MERGVYLANLLQCCADNKSHLSGKIIHAHIFRIGLFAKAFISNRLIEFYTKCNNQVLAQNTFDRMPKRDIYSWNALLTCRCQAGDLNEACKMFDEMPERNAFSWNNLISALVRSGYNRKALQVYSDMIFEGLLPTRFTLASALSACSALRDGEYGRWCHGISLKIGLDKNIYVANALLSAYSNCGMIYDAIGIFEDVREPSEVTFTAMMGGLGKNDLVMEALKVFKRMVKSTVRVDSVSLSSVLGVCCRTGCGQLGFTDELNIGFSNNKYGQQIHSLVVKLGFNGDRHVSNSLLDMYAKNGDMDSANIIFAYLLEPNTVSWNIMISGYGKNHQSDKAMKYLQNMQCNGFEPNEVTYINILTACANSSDIHTGRRIFDSMSRPSVNLYNAMLSGYSQTENHKEVLQLFRVMQFRLLKPDRTTLATILTSSAETGFLEAGKQVHAASLKSTLDTDMYIASGLISMYSKCKQIKMAERIFNYKCVEDIVCWNSMIAGFLINSLEKEAFMLFREMRQENVVPTRSSYATVLSCCAKLSTSFRGAQVHGQILKDGYVNDVFVGSAVVNMYSKCGDINRARQFFDTMSKKSTVTWNEMIHGYAQNGCGDEAVHLYRDMITLEGKPDIITFIAVLAACSHSGLVDVGVEILNSMSRDHGIDPELDHYICVIDSLGRAGKFHEAEKLVRQMPSNEIPVVWEILLSSCRVHANVSLAKQAAEKLFCLDPQNFTPYVLLAGIYASLGSWDEVRAVREKMSDRLVSKNPGFSWTEDNRYTPKIMGNDTLNLVSGG